MFGVKLFVHVYEGSSHVVVYQKATHNITQLYGGPIAIFVWQLLRKGCILKRGDPKIPCSCSSWYFALCGVVWLLDVVILPGGSMDLFGLLRSSRGKIKHVWCDNHTTTRWSSPRHRHSNCLDPEVLVQTLWPCTGTASTKRRCCRHGRWASLLGENVPWKVLGSGWGIYTQEI